MGCPQCAGINPINRHNGCRADPALLETRGVCVEPRRRGVGCRRDLPRHQRPSTRARCRDTPGSDSGLDQPARQHAVLVGSTGHVARRHERRLHRSCWSKAARLVLSLGNGDSHLLAETEDATFPFWSPDNQHVGFFTNRGLVRVPAAGGPSQSLAAAAMDSSGTWSDEGVVLFTGHDKPGIYRIAASGGMPVPLTTLDASREEIAHVHPRFLPGGRKFLYLALSRKPAYSGVYVRSLDVDDRKFLIQTPTHAEYCPPGLLLFVRESVLLAQRFDLSRLELQGEPTPVASNVNVSVDNGGAGFSVSRDGSLVYHAGQIPASLKWLDRHGTVTSTLALRAMFREVELSPDRTKVLVRIMPKETTLTGDLWTD